MPKACKPVSSSSSSTFHHRDPSRASPYAKNQNSYKKDELKGVKCPICFDHPHNAVLLICSSHDKGCRPYMCDTSHRHSNCLHQFCKLHSVTPLKSRTNGQLNKFVGYGATAIDEHGHHRQLACPFCRGEIKGWIVERDARRFMNSLVRDCALESCEFSGKYVELRKHARLQHPSSRPSFLVDNNAQSPETDQFHPYLRTIDFWLPLPNPSRDRMDVLVRSSDYCEIEGCFDVGNVRHCLIMFVRGAEISVKFQINGRIDFVVSGIA